MLLEKPILQGLNITTDGHFLVVKTQNELTEKQREFLEINKPQLMAELKKRESFAADIQPSKKRYGYYFEFEDNEGSGNVLTDTPPDEIWKIFSTRFPHRKIKTLELVH
jgi:hypothetical protein